MLSLLIKSERLSLLREIERIIFKMRPTSYPNAWRNSKRDKQDFGVEEANARIGAASATRNAYHWPRNTSPRKYEGKKQLLSGD